MKYTLTLIATAILAISCCQTPQTAIYLDESQPLEKRVEDALLSACDEARYKSGMCTPNKGTLYTGTKEHERGHHS